MASCALPTYIPLPTYTIKYIKPTHLKFVQSDLVSTKHVFV